MFVFTVYISSRLHLVFVLHFWRIEVRNSETVARLLEATECMGI